MTVQCAPLALHNGMVAAHHQQLDLSPGVDAMPTAEAIQRAGAEISHLAAAFEALDTDGDGRLRMEPELPQQP